MRRQAIGGCDHCSIGGASSGAFSGQAVSRGSRFCGPRGGGQLAGVFAPAPGGRGDDRGSGTRQNGSGRRLFASLGVQKGACAVLFLKGGARSSLRESVGLQIVPTCRPRLMRTFDLVCCDCRLYHCVLRTRIILGLVLLLRCTWSNSRTRSTLL